MDSLHFNTSDDAPRTPSPPSLPMRYSSSPQNYKTELDPVRIFSQDDDQYQWGQQQQQFPPPARPSLLQELYESDSPEHASPPDMYVEHDWPAPQPAPQQQHQRPQDYTMIRRATFPYARQERPEDLQYPPFLHHDTYPDAHPMPLSAEPSALHGHAHGPTYSPPGYAPADFDPHVKVEDHHAMPYQQQQHFYRGHPSMHPAHHMHPAHMHPHHAGMHPHAHHGGFAPHGLPVQHTDDAASKETQYLRRRCFNCHTTEPPSWRRSTLNPGKIVCNKCGLYERTHLRARPLRFDELRAGNKARGKGGKGVGGSPKQTQGGVKKTGAIARRNSVSSTGSSAQSGNSDWDDSVSNYSNGSAPPTSFNSPSLGGFSPHPPSLTLSSSSHSQHSHSSHNSQGSNSPGRDSLSRSPPLLGSPPHSAGSYTANFGSPHLGSPHLPHLGGGSPHMSGNGIRLPHAPDIPTLSHNGHAHGMRTKPRSNTTGGLGGGGGLYYSPPLHHSSSNSSLHSTHSPPSMHDGGSGGELYRRGSMPDMAGQVQAQGGWDDVNVKEEPRAVLV
ncbi:hypothetical protein B0H19DRAFT_112532 [Mycena capillaripes]|nr:hypothetical protein B0H19DRAFT_112532 [Mycena capillaripes]